MSSEVALDRARTRYRLSFLLLLTLPIGLQFLEHAELLQLSLSPAAISTGSIWRVVSGIWVHTNWFHCISNVSALAIVFVLYENRLSRIGIWRVTAGFSLALGVWLFMVLPGEEDYYGLSGLIHGILFLLSALDALQGKRMSLVIAWLVIVKIAFETLAGTSIIPIATLINARVAVEAHLLGVIVAIIALLIWRISQTFCPGRGK